ncbi:uncharacterized protein BJ212DRAFT_1303785 [Suillus subaureus]|uniref:DUF6699 domain-containing protein n=1 Tax=Suillus subaureus TaxID=48587 RepID=A0A9P7DY39_9AGAM|nr:uncharacterized protein BJ212DRAFT_1303785 [Suillus subaureus]KAG1806134.1 hypothetical protein BJ212DRAFT_1303785 [Suillus subaureus]
MASGLPIIPLPRLQLFTMFAMQHIDVANNVPSHRPRVNAAHTPSANITGLVDHNSRSLNGGAHAPFLQDAVDMHAMTRHDTENTPLIYNHSARRTMSSNVNETQKAYLHPFLATPSVPLIYDLRFPPTSLAFPSTSPYAGCGYELLFVPLTPERPRQIRLISPDFPWAFDIGPDPSAGEEGVTCLDVLTTLHAALQRPLTDTEWGTAGYDRRASLIRARDRRSMIQPVLQGSSHSAACIAPAARPVPGANVVDHRLVQRELLLLRIDWLGSRVAFVGLIKDEAFARSRLIPSGREPPETWVVKFKKL